MMSHKNRGVAVIINNQKFKKLNERQGSEMDTDNLQSMFRNLGFLEERIFEHKNVTAEGMLNAMKHYAANQSINRDCDYTDEDCFMCAISTHGDESAVWGTDKSNLSNDSQIICTR